MDEIMYSNPIIVPTHLVIAVQLIVNLFFLKVVIVMVLMENS